MERILQSAVLATLLCGAAIAQTAPASQAFDAADVHVSTPSSNAFMRVGFSRGRYEVHTATMLDLITIAYAVDGESVYGGPNWLETDRFEIAAKAPADSSEADRVAMLRALLADRFKLVVHKDEKPLDVFALTAGKKVQLKESTGSGDADCNPVGSGPQPYIALECRNFSMADFAKQFRQMAGGYVTHQMVDFTGLKGTYDFTLKWTARGRLRAAAANPEGEANPGISFFEAVDKQLGLKITPEKRSVPVIVVDSVNRTPTANAAGVGKSLPDVPTEFEVATVKPARPGNQTRRIQPKPGGRIEVENIPLKSLIALSWSFEQDEDRIVGAPKWIETSSYDIVAKTADFKMTEPPPFDTVRLMIGALLKERFKLAVHTEDQPVQVWELVVGKRGSKLKEADPASRSTCTRSAGDGGAANVPMINYSCTNTTMVQLAAAMHNIAPAYVDHVAVDATGLKGAYDFTLSWTPKGIVTGQAGRGGGDRANAADPNQPGVASDPSGGITFFDAVEKQLGLHLEGGRKRPQQVLVIDHIEQLVDEN